MYPRLKAQHGYFVLHHLALLCICPLSKCCQNTEVASISFLASVPGLAVSLAPCNACNTIHGLLILLLFIVPGYLEFLYWLSQVRTVLERGP